MNRPELQDELLLLLESHQRAMHANPSDPAPAFESGRVFAQLGDYASAVKVYQIALERDPSHHPAQFNLAFALSAQSHWAEAEQAYRRALRLRDDDHEAWANLGAVQEALGRTEDALGAYRKSLDLDPAEKEARHRIAILQIRHAEYAKAREVLEQGVDLDARDAIAWNLLGLTASHEGKDDTAREYYLRAIDIDNGLAKAWSNLGNLFARGGDTKAAENAYREALRRDEGDADIWFNLGEFYFRHNDAETERCLLRALEINRNDLEAWELLRQWYSRHPNYTIWKTALRVLLLHRKDDLSLLRELAAVNRHLGEAEEALTVLRHLISLDPEDEESRLLLAELYDEIGKPAEAFHHLEQLTLQTERAAALLFRLGQRMVHTGVTDHAETCFLKHIAVKPDDAHAWQLLGELALKREQLELAYERYTRALGINRNEVETWRPLADRFLQQGDPAHAVACLENLADVPRYLPETWRDYLSAYRLAGQTELFLERIERWMNDGWAAGRYWVELSELYRENGMNERADACLARAQSGDLDIGAELALARQALDRKDGQAALQHLERVRFLAGEDSLYWLTRGEAFYLLERYDEARESYERVLERDERHFRAWFHLGNIHFRAQRLVDAELAFRKAANLEPDQAKAWYNLGCVEDEQGRNALGSFSKANKLDRRFAPSWNALGVLHFRRGDDRLARRCFLRCLGCNRESVLGWENLAAVYRRTGRVADAEYCEQRLLRLGGEVRRGEGQAVRLFFDHDPQSR